jgi:hypothetical protein
MTTKIILRLGSGGGVRCGTGRGPDDPNPSDAVNDDNPPTRDAGRLDGTRVDDRDADEAREVVGVRRLVESWTPAVRVLVPEPVARAAEPLRRLFGVGVLRLDAVTPRDVAPLRTAPADPWPLRVAVAPRAADRVAAPARDADPARDDEAARDVEPVRDDEADRCADPARDVVEV